MDSSLIATQPTLILRHLTSAASLHYAHIHRLHHGLSLSPFRTNSKSIISPSFFPNLKISAINSIKTLNSNLGVLSGSTRTVTTLLTIALTASKFVVHDIFSLVVQLREPVLSAAGPALVAAMREAPTTSLNMPFTVVAAGMAKWLDIYSGVLMVRVLLSWFPNIPWDRQPLSAIRDLCDPYLNLFRNMIPSIFNTLDVSPFFAFTALGALGAILKSGR